MADRVRVHISAQIDHEVTQGHLDEATVVLEKARALHHEARSDPERKAAYDEASNRLSALRQAHREQEIKAGRRFARNLKGEIPVPSQEVVESGDAVAAPQTVAVTAEVPSGWDE